MAKPNTIKELIGDQTPFQWLTTQLKEYKTLTQVAENNPISRAALYDLIEREGLEVVQRVVKKQFVSRSEGDQPNN